MNVQLSHHPLVEGLHVLIYGDVEVYFNRVGYDVEEERLIFERGDDEVVTAKLKVCNEQLKVWADAFEEMSIELEGEN